MVIAGIDFGDARTGIAVCDKYEMMASEAGCVRADSYKKMLAAVAEKIRELNPERIVLGNPKNMNGTEGPRADVCKEFAQKLRDATGLPVNMWDERRTTVEAHNILSAHNYHGQKRKNTVDAVAASLILEGYLNFRKR